MSNFRPAPRKKNYIDYSGLRLSAPATGDSKQRPSFAVSVAKNGLRIDVYTNVEGDKNNGNIRMDLTGVNIFTLADTLRNLHSYENGSRFTIETKDYIWNNNKRSEKPMPQSRLVLGRDKQGYAFISLLSFDDSRPKIQFIFEAPFKSELLRNGQPIPETEVSVLVARAFGEAIASLTPSVLAAEFIEPEKKDKGGDNQRRGNGGGNGGGYRGNDNQNRDRNQSTKSDDFGGDSGGWEDDFAM